MAKFFGRVGYGETVETAPECGLMTLLSIHISATLSGIRGSLREGENLNNDLCVQ